MEAHSANTLVDGSSDYVLRLEALARGHVGPRSISSIDHLFHTGTVIGTSPAWRDVLNRATRVALTETMTCLDLRGPLVASGDRRCQGDLN
jgi:hypothetical protein